MGRAMHSRRPRQAMLLVGGGLILLIAIGIGQRLGDRVLSQATDRHSPIVGIHTTPVPGSTDPAIKNWRRDQVVSVATDPAFPDPRVTPPPTPRPTPPPPTPTQSPTPPRAGPAYTSPPLPLPIASHLPGETETEPPQATPTPLPPP
jgi:hypothetical protein